MHIIKARFKFDIPPEGRKLTKAECKLIHETAPSIRATPSGAWTVHPSNHRGTVVVRYFDKRVKHGACGAGWNFINTNKSIETNPINPTALFP